MELSISDYVLNISDKKYDKIYNNVLNFSNENDGFIIYVSSGSDSFFEKTFIDIINEKNLKNKILFIDSKSISSFHDVQRLIDSLDGEAVSKRELPIFIIVKNQKVSSIKSVGNVDSESLKNVLGEIYD